MNVLLMFRDTLPRRAAVDITTLDLEALPAVKPLVRPTLAFQAEVLNSSIETLQRRRDDRDDDFNPSPRPPIAGEIFTDGSALYIIALRLDRQRARTARSVREEVVEALTLFYFGPPRPGGDLDTMVKCVETSFGLKLAPYFYPARRFEELKSEGRESPPAPTSEEVAAADVLKDRLTRTLITAIKTSGGLLVRDLSRQLPAEERTRTDAVRQALAASGLIDSETVVICSKTQGQTARVPSKEVLAELSAKGLKCACGRSIDSERIEEALTLSERGRALLDKSRWLTVILVQQLLELGIPLDHLLVEQNLGGDEVDCLANVSGELVLFELKDKEFNLGNAYSFGAKIGILQPSRAVIVSTEHVGGDAKEHFQRAQLAQRSRPRYGFDEPATDIQYIEGIDHIPDRLGEILGSVFETDASRVVGEVLRLAFPDPGSVIKSLRP